MALPASDDDVVRLLESSPALKALLALPARVVELEARVRRLEAGPAARGTANPCPHCGAEMRLKHEVDHPTFALFGIKVRTFECTGCNKVTVHDHHPEPR